MELLLAIFSGGATGLAGTLFSRVFGFFEKAQEQKFYLQKYELQMKQSLAEMESEERIVQSKGATTALIESYKHDMSLGTGSRWVVNILRLVRPTITLSLWFLVAYIFYRAAATDASSLPWIVADSNQIMNQVIGTILYCATASTLWWFGSRDSRKA